MTWLRNMAFGKKVVLTLALATVAALGMLVASGAWNGHVARADPGPARIHINNGLVIDVHAIACRVKEGTAKTNGAFGPSAQGTFVVNLKEIGSQKPCGVISGNITFDFHPHTAGFSGFFGGTVASHNGPKPEGDFTGAFVFGNWIVDQVADNTGTTIGEGDIFINLLTLPPPPPPPPAP